MADRVHGIHIEFDLTSDKQVVCPHCQSGFVILTVGVLEGEIINIGFCVPEYAEARKVYCPYCGRNMKEVSSG